MLMTKRKPATIGEILTEEFIAASGAQKGALQGHGRALST